MPATQTDARQRDSTVPAVTRRRGNSVIRELVAHLREHRTRLRMEWAQRIIEARLLTAMNRKEVAAEVASIYDNYVKALQTGTFEVLQAYAQDLSERIIPRGVQTHEVVGIVLLLRDVLARSLFAKYQADPARLDRVLNAYEPAANRIATTVAVSFVEERERIIRRQRETEEVLRRLNEALEEEAKRIARRRPAGQGPATAERSGVAVAPTEPRAARADVGHAWPCAGPGVSGRRRSPAYQAAHQRGRVDGGAGAATRRDGDLSQCAGSAEQRGPARARH